MSRIAYVDGRYVPHRHAHVHIEDRGYQFADGVYEVILLLGGRPIDAGLHLARLARSLAELRIASPVHEAALRRIIDEVVRRNRIRDGLVYLQVTRGVARRDHAFPEPAPRPVLVITARRIPPFPASLDGWRATAITHPDERWARRDIKSIALLPNILARQAARQAGATEAILYAPDGMITEGAATNIWIVDAQGTLRTHPLGHAILPGCTRAALLGLLAESNIRHEERAFSIDELRAAREVLLTSATSYVKPIVAVDGAPVGAGLAHEGRAGPVAQFLFELFAAHVRAAAAGGAGRQ
jgi:D-alanine transaminase